MSEKLVISMRLENKAASQYLDWTFDSVVELNGVGVAFGPSGVYELTGDTFAGTEIDAYFDLPRHDMGRREQKSIEAVDAGYESAGDLTVTLTPDEKSAYARTVTLSPVKTGQVQQDAMQTLRKVANGKARYWGVRVANSGGCDFSVDYLALAPVVYRRRSGE